MAIEIEKGVVEWQLFIAARMLSKPCPLNTFFTIRT